MFNPNIPAGPDILSTSQGDLLGNFQDINTQFGVNHVTFSPNVANSGKHNLVSLVEQPNDPESIANEYLLFSAEDVSGDTEIYARPPSNANSYQITKDGSLFTGLLPFAAVNFDTTGTIQGDALNVASIARPGNAGTYVITFTTPAADNNFFWSVSGFDNSANPVISQVTNNANYNTVVTANTISFSFSNQNATSIIGLTRASVIVWRYQ